MQAEAPAWIRLEASSVCQLRCPSCPTTQGLIEKGVGSGLLKFDDFKRLIDENPSVRFVELSNWGEIFLNPYLLSIMEYAFAKKVALQAVNGANLNYAREEVLDGLVKYKFRYITCSLDGASQETYQRYRVRGKFNNVIANIKKINRLKEEYRSEFPKLKWQFVIFGHNEHEIEDAKKMAVELGMDFSPKFSWDESFSPIKDKAGVKQSIGLPYASEEEYLQVTGTTYMRNQICTQLWTLPQINWDGRILGCCVNYWSDFGGNAFQEGLVPSLHTDRMQYAREMLMGTKEEKEDIPCSVCPKYHSMREGGNFLTAQDIEQSELALLFQSLSEYELVDEGFDRIEKGKTEAAKRIFLNILSRYSDSPYGHVGLGEILLREGRDEEALGEFVQAIDKGARDHGPFSGIGKALLMKGDNAGAKEAFLRALALNPPLSVENYIRGILETL